MQLCKLHVIAAAFAGGHIHHVLHQVALMFEHQFVEYAEQDIRVVEPPDPKHQRLSLSIPIRRTVGQRIET